MKAALCRLKHRVGRRGAFLLVLAYVDFVYGYASMLVTESAADAERHRYLGDAIPFIKSVDTSMQAWAGIWWTVGLLCLINAFRKPPQSDLWGFGPAAALKVVWVMVLAIASYEGLPGGWRTASVWLVTLAAVLIIGGWPEEPMTLKELSDQIDSGEIPRMPRGEGDRPEGEHA